MHRTFAVLTALVACTDPLEIATVESAAWSTGDCPKEDCGMNTTVMDGVYFNRLSFLGEPNESGVSLIGYPVLPLDVIRLDVVNDHLVGLDAFGAPIKQAAQLVGSILELAVDGKTYWVRLAAVHRSARYWAADDGTRVETYTFQYLPITRIPTTTWVSLCKSEPTLGGLALDAVVFEHESYDAVTKQIDDPGPGWFNIACLGSAPAKMFMMRHTTASSNITAGVTTNLAQRRALLNAWTGNYCGDGTSFTTTGQPLRMRDDSMWIAHPSGWSWTDHHIASQINSYEAVWNESGALCLDVPRLQDTNAAIYDEILAHCDEVGHPLPPCTGGIISATRVPSRWQNHGHILTANPLGS